MPVSPGLNQIYQPEGNHIELLQPKHARLSITAFELYFDIIQLQTCVCSCMIYYIAAWRFALQLWYYLLSLTAFLTLMALSPFNPCSVSKVTLSFSLMASSSAFTCTKMLSWDTES